MKPWLLAPLVVSLVACSAAEKVDPVPQPAASASDAGPPPPEPSANTSVVKRTVMTRNPFGSHPGNYLPDGDFEFSSLRNQGAQVGWRAFDATGSQFLNIMTETGGLCRSGLRCAVLEPKMLMLVHGAAAADKGTVASIAAKVPADSDCHVVTSILVTCDDVKTLKALHADKHPGPDGWCVYTTDVPPQNRSTCIYVESQLASGETALLDDATMGPDDGTISTKSGEIFVPTAEMLDRIGRVQDLVRRTRRHDRARPAPRGPTP